MSSREVFVVEFNGQPVDHAYTNRDDAEQAAEEIRYEGVAGDDIRVVRYVPAVEGDLN